MTTSQPQAQVASTVGSSTVTPTPVVASTTKLSPELTDDRAASIGWYFITSYYDFYNSKIDTIYRLYQQNAKLSHSSFPEKSAEKTIHKAQGTEAIKSRFADDLQLKDRNNRIIITSAVFEVSLGKNILIVAQGEWSRNDSPYYQFVQTFILTPGKNEKNFDVANDVLKFIDFEEFALILATKSSSSPATATTAPSSTSTPAAPAPVSSPSKDPVAIEAPIEIEPVEPVEAKKEVKEVKEAKEAKETKEVKEVKAVKENESNDTKTDIEVIEQPPTEKGPKIETVEQEVTETTTPSTASVTSAPVSWAAAAAAAASAAKSTKATASKSKKPVPVVPAQAVATPVSPASTASATGKSKKDSFFPIYIRGVGPIKQERLESHLVKNFGEVKFLQKSDKIALCEFYTAESQEKALQARETIIDGYTISLEPRESKNGGGYSGHHGPPKSTGNAPAGNGTNGAKKYPPKDKVRTNSANGTAKFDKFAVRKAKPGRAE